MKRGEIWWVDLEEPHGAEPGYRRPGVIISSDRFNDTNLDTVLIVFLTSNLRLAGMPGNVELSARGTGLKQASVVNVTQIATVDRIDMVGRIGRVPAPLMSKIDDGLRLVMSL